MFNDCFPKFITAKTSFLAGLFAVEPMGQRKVQILLKALLLRGNVY